MRGEDAALPYETQVSMASGNPVQGLKFTQESGAYPVLLFLAEFLERRIGPQKGSLSIGLAC